MVHLPDAKPVSAEACTWYMPETYPLHTRNRHSLAVRLRSVRSPGCIPVCGRPRVPPKNHASRPTPHTDEIGALASISVARVAHLASRAVESEASARVRVLVCDEQPLARLVELEVAWRLASCVEDAGEGEHARWFRVVVDAMDGDRVVATIGGDDEIAGRVDSHTAARVHLGRKSLRQCAYSLYQHRIQAQAAGKTDPGPINGSRLRSRKVQV